MKEYGGLKHRIKTKIALLWYSIYWSITERQWLQAMSGPFHGQMVLIHRHPWREFKRWLGIRKAHYKMWKLNRKVEQWAGLAGIHNMPGEEDSDLSYALWSLNKWIMTRPHILKDYFGLKPVDIYRKLGSDTCPFCIRYRQEGQIWDGSDTVCKIELEDYEAACPLTVLRDGHRCDERYPDDEDNPSPYGHWLENHNPEPMIALLKDTVKMLEDIEISVNHELAE